MLLQYRIVSRIFSKNGSSCNILSPDYAFFCFLPQRKDENVTSGSHLLGSRTRKCSCRVSGRRLVSWLGLALWQEFPQIWEVLAHCWLELDQIWLDFTQIWLGLAQVWLTLGQCWLGLDQIWLKPVQSWLTLTQSSTMTCADLTRTYAVFH